MTGKRGRRLIDDVLAHEAAKGSNLDAPTLILGDGIPVVAGRKVKLCVEPTRLALIDWRVLGAWLAV